MTSSATPSPQTPHPLQHHTICVDGPTASGKGTLAKRLAQGYRLKFLDTGLLYRAVAYQVTQSGHTPENPAAAERAALELVFDFRHKGNNVFGAWVNGVEVTEDLRTPQTGKNASLVAIQPRVRAALLAFQQNYVSQWQPQYGVVLDGRDTGARIAPTASLKFFLTASAQARAERRHLEYTAKGQTITLAQVLADLQARDARDAPNTIQAPDAVVLDATHLTADQILHQAHRHILAKFGASPFPT